MLPDHLAYLWSIKGGDGVRYSSCICEILSHWQPPYEVIINEDLPIQDVSTVTGVGFPRLCRPLHTNGDPQTASWGPGLDLKQLLCSEQCIGCKQALPAAELKAEHFHLFFLTRCMLSVAGWGRGPPSPHPTTLPLARCDALLPARYWGAVSVRYSKTQGSAFDFFF